jgi:hypothetical protein
MSYEVKKDEMVGKYVAEFQEELTLARKLRAEISGPRMPYGYPTALYHPHHAVLLPRATTAVRREHSTLSNEVPWAVSMEVVNANVIGVYNPNKGARQGRKREDRDQQSTSSAA